ncbi:hypothetical protein PHISCL_07060 [Aspergillus sclerotialis]|uniref:Uncharacterized protein n=1 Tax=Aspergillus sclerotialis TaxID=2070753 RepID=A0A3A2ZGU3_9EURO|nr:hypothetical protein PHISCL_07060 [Aspergillus sclerotialis]
MPALTLHLFALTQGTDPKTFVQKLRQAGITVVVSSRPRHVVVPTTLDSNPLVTQRWDLLVLLQTPGGTFSLPNELQQAVRNEYKIVVGIPSKLLGSYPERDAKLKREASSTPLTGSLENAQGKSSSKNLEVSPDLLAFMDELTKEHDKPVTMLNLLQFHHPDGKKNYYQYGQAFIPVAGKRGGSAKLVGNVVKPGTDNADSRGRTSRPETNWWNEISIVHYPSIRHFCDMLAGDDYQAINAKYRLAALRDTFLLCTTEFDLEENTSAKL